MKTLLVLGLMLVATGVLAQAPVANGIGFYWDEAANYDCLVTAAPYSQLNVYLFATNTTQTAGMSGWEAEIAIVPAPAYPATYTLHNGGVNALTAPIFQVSMATVLPYAPAMKLLTVSTINLSIPFLLAVGPCTPSSFGGLCPGYADGADPGLLIGLTPSQDFPPTGRPYFHYVASFGMECGPCLATESDSWSSVKRLYE